MSSPQFRKVCIFSQTLTIGCFVTCCRKISSISRRDSTTAASENWQWLRKAIASEREADELSQLRAAQAAVLALSQTDVQGTEFGAAAMALLDTIDGMRTTSHAPVTGTPLGGAGPSVQTDGFLPGSYHGAWNGRAWSALATYVLPRSRL